MHIIDLSHKITDRMMVDPGDAEVNITQIKHIAADGYNAYHLSTGMHAGTHVDIPNHLLEGQALIDEIPPEKFIGRGVVLDVRGRSRITYSPEYESKINEGDAVLIYTGFDEMYNDRKKYFTGHPVIEKNLCEMFIRKKIKMIGIDFPSPDMYPFEIHKMLLESGIFIVENLTNLSPLLSHDTFQFFAMPLKIRAEASLVRAFAAVCDLNRTMS